MAFERFSDVNDVIDIHRRYEGGIILIGAGKDGKAMCDCLLEKSLPVLFFIDENEYRHGQSYYAGLDVYYPNEIQDMDDNAVALVCIGEMAFYDDSTLAGKSLIKGLKIDSEHIFIQDKGAKVEKLFLECLRRNKIRFDQDILQIGAIRLHNYMLEKPFVKRVFLEQINDLVMPRIFDEWSCIDEGPYEDAMILTRQERMNVIDCGANIGIFSATAAAFGHNVYAFEPIKRTRDLLAKTAKLYDNIIVVDKALSDKSGSVAMSDTDNLGQNKIIENGGISEASAMVEVTTIDKFVEKEGLNRVDYIKSDIEGEERKMIMGAKETIKKYHPMLALCTYHLDDDPWALEQGIKEICPDYKVVHKYRKLFAYV